MENHPGQNQKRNSVDQYFEKLKIRGLWFPIVNVMESHSNKDKAGVYVQMSKKFKFFCKKTLKPLKLISTFLEL